MQQKLQCNKITCKIIVIENKILLFLPRQQSQRNRRNEFVVLVLFTCINVWRPRQENIIEQRVNLLNWLAHGCLYYVAVPKVLLAPREKPLSLTTRENIIIISTRDLLARLFVA